jgi:hypothetical protein
MAASITRIQSHLNFLLKQILMLLSSPYIWTVAICLAYWWVWSSWWIENWQRRPTYWDKTHPCATVFTTNPTWPDLRSNLVGGLYYGVAIQAMVLLPYWTGRLLLFWNNPPPHMNKSIYIHNNGLEWALRIAPICLCISSLPPHQASNSSL